MVLLGIETATSRLSAALISTTDDAPFRGERATSARSSHCELISGFIQELLDEAGYAIQDIDVVAVSAGPGSFTGLRIGIATAMGLAYGLDIKACAVSTLAGLAWKAAPIGSLVCPLIDAKRGEAYTALYRLNSHDTAPEPVFQPAAVPVADLAERLGSLGEPVTLTGPSAFMFADRLLPSCHPESTVTTPEQSEPSALDIADIGLILANKGLTVVPAALKPVYLRRSDAELALAKRCSS